MKKVKISRRQFILNSALMGGAMFLPSMAKAEKTSINGKMNIALIGVGGIGSLTISTLKKCPEARISALCDVDDTRIAGGAKEYPNAPKLGISAACSTRWTRKSTALQSPPPTTCTFR